jgi:hypothetical protein
MTASHSSTDLATCCQVLQVKSINKTYWPEVVLCYFGLWFPLFDGMLECGHFEFRTAPSKARR